MMSRKTSVNGERRPLLLTKQQSSDSETYQSFPIPPSDPTNDVRTEAEQSLLGSTLENDAETRQITTSRAVAIIAALGVLVFLQASNISLLTTTQGVIASDLDAFEEASWFTSAFLVASSSIGPINGRLTHIFTPRYCIFCSALILSIGSLVTAFAPSLAVFLLGRAIAGTGASGIFIVSVILVVQLTKPKRRGLFNGLLNTGYTIGVASGAILAGALEPIMGWRALFWMQSPLAFLAGVILLLSVPSNISADDSKQDSEDETVMTKIAQIDYLGAILLIFSIVFLLYGLSTPKISILPIALSIVLFPIFVYQETYRTSDPIIPIAVLRSRGALLSCFATLGFMMARWAVLFYSPIYAIAVRGWTPAKAGSILIPTNTGFAFGGLISGFAHIRRGGSFYAACLVIFALFPLSLLALATVATDTSPTWLVVLCTFANGLCAGAALNYTLAHVLHLVLPDVRFVVTSLLATFRGFAGTFGSAIGGGIFVRVLQGSLERGFERHGGGMEGRAALVRRLLGSPRAVKELSGVERAIAVKGYMDAVRALFIAGVVLSVLMFFVQAGTGWQEPKREDVASDVEDSIPDGRGNPDRGIQDGME